MIPLLLPDKMETERLVLQKLKYEDADEIFYTYASKPEATRFVGWKTHQSTTDTVSYLHSTLPLWKKQVDFSYSIRKKVSNRLVGSIGVINQNGNIHFGYILSPTQWNQGYATEAVKMVLQNLIVTKGIKKIETFVDTENLSSIRVLEKCGLQRVELRKKGFRFPNQTDEWKDCYVFSLPLPADHQG